jgi:hypothetical protein
MLNVFALAGVAVLAVLLRQLQAQQLQTARALRLARLTPGQALNENIEKVRTGDSPARVETTLGKADSAARDAWVYFADDNSGYVVYFDAGRVTSVYGWFS